MRERSPASARYTPRRSLAGALPLSAVWTAVWGSAPNGYRSPQGRVTEIVTSVFGGTTTTRGIGGLPSPVGCAVTT